MRAALISMSVLLSACTVTQTVPLKDSAAYFHGDTVITKEGYRLRWDDGGRLVPLARKGLCLVDAGEDAIAVGDRDVPLRILTSEPGSDCAEHRVLAPLRASIGDDTLTIVGRKRAIRVPTRALYGLRVEGADNELGDKEPRSTPLAVAGGVVTAGGVGGAVAAAVVLSQDEPTDATSDPFYRGLIISGVVASLGAGVTMLVVGGTLVPVPVKLEVGLGGAATSLSF